LLKENILQFKQIPAFQDNYIWMLSFGGYAWVVDPGDASPVISVLETEKLKLAGILVTHHHNDHVGGIGQLLSWAKSGEVIQVVGPLKESISHVNQSVIEGDRVELFAGVQAQVLEVPGHTKGHIAFYLEKSPFYPSPILFCGDTLFASGCGRLFEGTPAQMSASLDKFAQLPTDALVCCAHEYTHSNIRFSLAVEADNREVSDWAQKVLSLRAENKPTVPTTIGHELLVNPFLRCSQESVMKSASEFAHKDLKDPVDVFAALRSWKDIFK
jgi:hydroxyacylglutathione hydrolase